jgi:hypothetical protein
MKKTPYLALLAAALAVMPARAQDDEPDPYADHLRTKVLGELGLPEIRMGSGSTYGRPFADLSASYTRETRPTTKKQRRKSGRRVQRKMVEGLWLDVDLGADGRHQGWGSELVGLGFRVGAANGEWDDRFFIPIASAQSAIGLRLGGVQLITLEAEKDLAIGETVRKRIGSKSKRYKLGPVKVNVESRIYAALGTELGGTVFFSKPGGKFGSDLGIGAALTAELDSAVQGRISAGTKHASVGGTARFTLVNLLDQWTLAVRRSGVEAQLRLRAEAISAYVKVWVKVLFYKGSRTLVNWSLARWERVFDLI